MEMDTLSNESNAALDVEKDTPDAQPHDNVTEASIPGQLDDPERRAVSWGVIGWLAVLHVGVLLAPFTFSVEGLILAVVLHWVTGGLGVCLGFHRYR